MRVTILGSGTHVPDPDRGPAGFLVEEGGARVLVDGGSGTIGRLARAGVDARDLDALVYTHRHVDHCADLAPILFTLCVPSATVRTRELPVWAGEGFASFLAALQAAWGSWIVPSTFPLRVVELPLDGPGRADLPGGLVLDTLPALHSAGALHLKFTAPDRRTVVFSGDTAPSAGLVDLARGCDLLVCECSLEDGQDVPGHLAPTDVAALATQARPGRLVLTHMYPREHPDGDVVRIASTGVPTLRARDGDAFDL
ncbi:MAG: ribonuclease Z [Deltaproteobacteria bacterium]|nr:ribonuclease Z [Deltaproteobacteria bacterium]